MARGWESKSVESQQEEMSRATPRGPAPTAEQVARAERRRTLELQRRRVEAEIARATAPAHRHMLEEALLALTAKMAELDELPSSSSGAYFAFPGTVRTRCRL
jgi:hypothetical protein